MKEKLAIGKEKVEFDLSTDNEVIETKDSNRFGENETEMRWVQIPRGQRRKFLTYEEWREEYKKIIEAEDFGKPLYEKTPEWKKERAIKIYWEEGLSDCEKKMGASNTARKFSPDIQEIVDYNIFIAVNFEHLWNDSKEEWKETMKRFHNRENWDEVLDKFYNREKRRKRT